MAIFAELSDWIQPQHLDATYISAYQEQFKKSSAGTLQIQNFFIEDRIRELANYIIEKGTYKQVYGLFSTEHHTTTKENWDLAKPSDHFYLYKDLHKFSKEQHEDTGYKTYQQMRKMCLKPEFHQYISALTTIPFIGTRVDPVHRMGPGQYIRRHSDKHGSRRLTFLIYLTPNWKPEYGGKLKVYGRNKSTVTLEATFNSCVIFDMKRHKTHEVTDILPTAGDVGRLSMACRLHESQKSKQAA